MNLFSRWTYFTKKSGKPLRSARVATRIIHLLHSQMQLKGATATAKQDRPQPHLRRIRRAAFEVRAAAMRLGQARERPASLGP